MVIIAVWHCLVAPWGRRRISLWQNRDLPHRTQNRRIKKAHAVQVILAILHVTLGFCSDGNTVLNILRKHIAELHKLSCAEPLLAHKFL